MAVAVLALAVLAAGAPAAESDGFLRNGIVHESGSWLAGLWDDMTAFWSQAGCEIDPSGRCVSNPNVDIGCEIDPNGGCANKVDIGCEIDPDGRCVDSK
jgi:hypothetical protein